MTSKRIAMAMALGLGLTTLPARAVFDPATYVGTWSGTWKNTTFKVDGTITATITASEDGQTMTVDYTITNLFNCGDTTASRVLTKGVDFSDTGLNFTTTNTQFGTSTVTSESKKKLEKVAITGTPTCRGDIPSYTVKAKLKGTSLKGKMTVTFASGSPKKGKTKFTATKS